MKKLAFVAAGLIVFLSSPLMAIGAPTVTINGYNVTGITNQKFENVAVEFDASGNIIISAPNYKLVEGPTKPVNNGVTVESVFPSTSPSTTSVAPSVAGEAVHYDRNALPDLTNPTYLVAQFSEVGLLGYHVDVYINGKYIKELKQNNGQQTMDVSKYLVSGKNTVQYRLVRSADVGVSMTAYVELWFAKLEDRNGTSLNLAGQYGEMKIMGKNGETSYTVELTAP